MNDRTEFCPACEGYGAVQQQEGRQVIRVDCPVCKGKITVAQTRLEREACCDPRDYLGEAAAELYADRRKP